MTTARGGYLSAGAALVSAHLLVVALLDGASRIWPPRTGDLVWRIVATTQFLNSIGLLITAIALCALIGLLSRAQGVLVLASFLSAASAMGIMALLMLMALDYLQLRTSIVREKVREWDVTVLISGVTGALATVCLLVLAVGAVQVWRVLREPGNRDKQEGSPLLVVGR